MGCVSFVGFSSISTKSSVSDSFSLPLWFSRVEDVDKEGQRGGEESPFEKYLFIERV